MDKGLEQGPKVFFLGSEEGRDVVGLADEETATRYTALLLSPPPLAVAVKPLIVAKAKKTGPTMFGIDVENKGAKPPPAAKKASGQGQKASGQGQKAQVLPKDLEKFGDLKKYAEGIYATRNDDPYTTGDMYPLRTRLGFQQQILNVYRNFSKIPEEGKAPDYDACKRLTASGGTAVEMYEYQKFVREYVQWASPYRGLLVYHGLGSGKTCSAIAAAEALLSVSRKKIIVMTPSSLRYNFIREISFCGFRHLRLQNFWVPIDITPENKETVKLFASQILNATPKFAESAKRIWVPDFSVEQPNFKILEATDRKEIVLQIENQINNSIQFINYNGISASELKKIACAAPDENGYRLFDNSVIVVDEIHNLTRLMQGTIEPYLSDLGIAKRKVPLEPIMPGPWEPALCKLAQDERTPYLTNYKRGYLFYRLLSGARNSKIIGLSGTPLINFPEEIAILANIIGGYLHTCSIKANPADNYREVKKLLEENVYVDFVEVDTLGGNIQILFSALPEGMKKTKTATGNLALQRVSPEEATPTIQEVTAGLIKQLTDMGMRILEGPTYKSEPLLPPVGEEFRETFVDGLNLKNTFVLRKRLQGLVSYYRGSKKELMPAVTKDEVVFVPFSEFARKEYEKVRSEELNVQKEKDKKKSDGDLKGVGKMANLWAEIYDLAKMKESSSYRIASRLSCNFAYPEGYERPRPKDKKATVADLGLEAEQEEIFVDAPADADNEEKAEYEAAGVREEVVDDKQVAAAVAAEDAAIDAALEEGGDGPLEMPATAPVAVAKAEVEAPTEGGAQLYSFETDESFRLLEGGADTPPPAEPAPAPAAPAPAAPAPAAPAPVAPAPAAEAPKKKTLDLQQKHKEARLACIADIAKAGKDANRKLKECMQKYERASFLLYSPPPNLKDLCKENIRKALANEATDPKRLAKYSPKYAEILKRILSSPGSSLVYSAFLDMEGIGIFSIALMANGFHAIELIKDSTTGTLAFSDATIKHLMLGKQEHRFLKFTGTSTPLEMEIRNMSLKLFNAKYEDGNFVELPPQMSKVLVEAGYTGNVDGGLCRTFCITAAGAEGLSLKNVRRVHIMEPFWNHVRTDQVKGRAVRICSHIDLDLADRNVEVFTYCSVFDDGITGPPVKIESEVIRSSDAVKPDEAIEMGFKPRVGEIEYFLSSDQHLYQLSQRKKKVLQNIQNLMKTSAVDCTINKYENEEEGLGCITLPDKPQQYAFHPILKKDIAETSTQFPKDAVPEVPKAPDADGPLAQGPEAADAAEVQPKAKPSGKKAVDAIIIKLKGTDYISVSTAPLTRTLYSRGDTALTRKMGEYSTDAEGKRIGDVRWISQAF
jgi:hypothetical protein